MRRFGPAFACSLLLLFLTACTGPAAAGSSRSAPRSENYVEFSAKVVLSSLEGGFCGLVAEDGQRYEPVNLPLEFCQDGLAVKVSGERIVGGISFRMWGKQLRIETIERR